MKKAAYGAGSGLVGHILKLDLALDDLQKGDVRLTQTRTTLDERRTAAVELTDTLRDHVDEDRRIFDDLGGLFDEFSFHRQ